MRVSCARQVGRYGQETFDFSAERVTASVSESLRRLQVPYIDLIQCHDIEFGDLDKVTVRLWAAPQRGPVPSGALNPEP